MFILCVKLTLKRANHVFLFKAICSHYVLDFFIAFKRFTGERQKAATANIKATFAKNSRIDFRVMKMLLNEMIREFVCESRRLFMKMRFVSRFKVLFACLIFTRAFGIHVNVAGPNRSGLNVLEVECRL